MVDETEVSIFGPGYGECVCIHLPGGRWVIIDSCLDRASGQPASVSYLSDLGVPVAEAVALVIVTHWDDDHIRGIGRVARECQAAQLVCSAALRKREILEFVVAQEQVAGAIGSGVDELRTLLRISRSRGGMVWAKANLPLYPRPPGDQPAVVSLSPSEDAVERSVEALVEAATDSRSTVPRRFRAPEEPNGASVAVSIRAGETHVLLGADLEGSSNPETGWNAVLSYSKPPRPASLIKVPHHGSRGAHHDGMWNEMVVPPEEAVAIVTPWAKGALHLPTEADLVRLRQLGRHLFITAVPAAKRVKKDRAVERLIKRLHGDDITALAGWGHVRARRGPEHANWDVEVRGDAVAVDPS